MEIPIRIFACKFGNFLFNIRNFHCIKFCNWKKPFDHEQFRLYSNVSFVVVFVSDPPKYEETFYIDDNVKGGFKPKYPVVTITTVPT